MQKILLNSSSIWYGLDNIKKQASALLWDSAFLSLLKKKTKNWDTSTFKKHNKNKINNLLKKSKSIIFLKVSYIYTSTTKREQETNDKHERGFFFLFPPKLRKKT